MRYTLAIVALILGHGATIAQRSPSQGELEANATGKLMAFVHGARAYKTECAIALQSRKHDRVFENWTARNEKLIDMVDAAGRSMQWFNPDGFGPSEAWSRMQRREASRIEHFVADQIRSNPGEACANAAGAFEAGEFDLAKFTPELKVLRIKWP